MRFCCTVVVGLLIAACSPGSSQTTVVAGTVLTKAPTELTVQCATTAHQVGFAVPCPTKVPVGSHPTVFVAGNCPGRSVWIGPGCDGEVAYAFASIEWPSQNRRGHLVLVGAPTVMSAQAIIYSPLPLSEAGVVPLVGSTTVEGVEAGVYAVPDDSATAFGSHLVMVWTINGHTYAFGFHGTDVGARALDDAATASLRVALP